jgi:hypothetical protein
MEDHHTGGDEYEPDAQVGGCLAGRPVVLAGQRYRTSSPVTARPMIMRWISEVPSKMVKLPGVVISD